MSYASYDEVPQDVKDKYESGFYNNVYMDPELRHMLADGTSAKKTSAAVDASSQSGGIGGLAPKSTPYDTRNIANNDLGTYMANQLYGGSSQNIGQDSTDYANAVKGRMNNDYAKADIYRQESGQRIGQANAKAGLSGVDTAGASEQTSRQASMGAATMNQDYKDKALALFGRNVSARQQGVSGLDMAGRGLTNAATPTPTPNYESGCSMCIFATKMFLKREISKKDLLKIMEAGRSFGKKRYIGYILIATPLIKMNNGFLAKKILIPAFISYGNKNPNITAKILITLSGFIGTIYSFTGSSYHLKLMEKHTINDVLMKRELSC